MKIGPHEIGREPFTIAEASLNHLGDPRRARDMVFAAKKAGCSSIKFQTYRTEGFCAPDDPMFATFKKCELPDEAWPMLAKLCKQVGITFLSTPQNPEDLEKLLPLGMPAIKIGSDDALNCPLLDEYRKHGLPLLISTGMCDRNDIVRLKAKCARTKTVFMICTSQYPSPPSEVNISRLRSITYPDEAIMGFSDHTIGNTASIMAVALGACVFERHFTLDHNLPGPEHKWACNPDELASWVSAIKEAWAMKGTGNFELSEREREQKRRYQRRPGQLIRGEA